MVNPAPVPRGVMVFSAVLLVFSFFTPQTFGAGLRAVLNPVTNQIEAIHAGRDWPMQSTDEVLGARFDVGVQKLLIRNGTTIWEMHKGGNSSIVWRGADQAELVKNARFLSMDSKGRLFLIDEKFDLYVVEEKGARRTALRIGPVPDKNALSGFNERRYLIRLHVDYDPNKWILWVDDYATPQGIARQDFARVYTPEGYSPRVEAAHPVRPYSVHIRDLQIDLGTDTAISHIDRLGDVTPRAPGAAPHWDCEAFHALKRQTEVSNFSYSLADLRAKGLFACSKIVVE